MLATQIQTHIADALNRLMQQYRGQPNIAGLYTSFVQQIQDLENAIFALDAGRQLFDGASSPAVGQQLDEIGTIVGISRNGLSDAEYLLFIFGKIAENFSDTTIPTILNIIGYVFQAEQVLLQEIYPAGIAIQMIGSPINPSLYVIAKSLVQSALGAGIGIVFAGASPNLNVFRFEAPDTTAINGFGDVNNPSVGGIFIGLI